MSFIPLQFKLLVLFEQQLEGQTSFLMVESELLPTFCLFGEDSKILDLERVDFCFLDGEE